MKEGRRPQRPPGIPPERSSGSGLPYRSRWQFAIRDDGALTTPQKLTALVLSLHADADGGSCFPSYATLAAETVLHERTVKRAVSDLDTRGYLTIAAGGGRGHSNRYRLKLPSDAQDLVSVERETVEVTDELRAVARRLGIPRGALP